jgi:hypothetical protein
MANELELTSIVKYNKAGIKADLSLSTRVDISGDKIYEGVQEVSTSPTDPVVGSVTLAGAYIVIENLSDTMTISVENDAETAVVFCTIPPRGFAGPLQAGAGLLKLKSTISDGTPAAANVRVIAISP